MNLDEIRSFSKKYLKGELEKLNKNTTGSKADLVARYYAAIGAKTSSPATASSAESEVHSKNNEEVTYQRLLNTIKDPKWSKDLRNSPDITFVQLYDYLVVKTAKYDRLALKSSGTGYKKLKSFNFFAEGHIKSIEVTSSDEFRYVKSLVMASMLSKRYGVIIAFNNNNDVVKVFITRAIFLYFFRI